MWNKNILLKLDCQDCSVSYSFSTLNFFKCVLFSHDIYWNFLFNKFNTDIIVHSICGFLSPRQGSSPGSTPPTSHFKICLFRNSTQGLGTWLKIIGGPLWIRHWTSGLYKPWTFSLACVPSQITRTGYFREVYQNYYLLHTRSVRKVSCPNFCENLVDFDEARLPEVTLNFDSHAWIFSAFQ